VAPGGEDEAGADEVGAGLLVELPGGRIVVFDEGDGDLFDEVVPVGEQVGGHDLSGHVEGRIRFRFCFGVHVGTLCRGCDNPQGTARSGRPQPGLPLFFWLLSGSMKDLRPVVVRGPVTAGVARVVVDDSRVVVVTQKERRGWNHDGEGLVQNGAPNKFVVNIPSESEPLVVVKAGGCTCGKPWIKAESGSELLQTVGV